MASVRCQPLLGLKHRTERIANLTIREDALFYDDALERLTRPMNGDR